MRSATARRPAAVLALASLLALAPSAVASPAGLSGSYDVTAAPGGVNPDGGCAAVGEGATRHTHPLRAPSSGWLHVELSGFTGDWELAVEDAPGRWTALSTVQWDTLDHVDAREEVDVYLHKGRQVAIATCNWAGSATARVEFQLVPGAASRPVERKRSAVTRIDYRAPAAATEQAYGLCHVGLRVGCVASPPPSWARYVTVAVDDATSPAVAAQLYEYYGSTYYPQRSFCTSLDRPVALTPRADWVGVHLLTGPCADGTPAQATSGTATFTWSTHP